MQKNKDDIINKNLYANLLGQYGDDFRSLNWGSHQSQEKRFEVFASIANLQNSNILDVGCGLSHFYEWLTKKNVELEYHGIDITPEMINKSKQKFPSSTFSIGTILDDIPASLRQYDFVFASGIFYLRANNPKEYMEHTITKMFSLSNKGIAFNCLSTWANDKDAEEFYADPIEIICYCKTLTNKIILQHHYHPADFTIILYK
jgi:cyclopropane fatty-acyl-phospholipid synthase-like methyltransferase